VFVVHLSEDDVPGRRWLLCEPESGDVVPTLYHNTPDLKGVNCRWAFGLSALEPSTSEVIEDSTELRTGFAKKFGLRDYDTIGFEESAVETCRLEAMREQRNIFAAGEKKQSSAESLPLQYSGTSIFSNFVICSYIRTPTGVLFPNCESICLYIS
jgi:hypothetical protein